jgi:peptidase C25-like protein
VKRIRLLPFVHVGRCHHVLAAVIAIGLLGRGRPANAIPQIGITAETLGKVFTTAVTSGSYAHSVPSTGSNRLLIVTYGSTAGATPVADISSIVWDPDTTIAGNEQTLTCAAALDLVISTFRRLAICTLLNPTPSTGHGQVTITLTAADTFTSSATTMTGVASVGSLTGSGASKTFGTWSDCVGATGYLCTIPLATVADEVLFDLIGQGEPMNNMMRTAVPSGVGQNKHEDSASLVTGDNLRIATSVTIATGTTTTLKWTCGGATSSNGVGEVILTITAASSVTAATPSGMGATTHGAAGTRLTWQTEEEVSHLGFQVWRERDGARTRISRGLIPGSMFATGDLPLAGRRHYELWDAQPDPDGNQRYWLEEIGTTGSSRWHGPIAPVAGGPTVLDRALPAAILPRPFALSSRSAPSAVAFVAAGNGLSRPHLAPRDTRQAVSALTDPTCANGAAALPSLKIGVSAPGWYRITLAALVTAGLPAHTDPTRLGLYTDGRSVAMNVTGRGPDASIEFYGAGLDTPETATHVYWLVANDEQATRVALATPTSEGPRTTSYLADVERRDRTIYFAALLNGPAGNFFGPPITDAPVTQTLEVSAPLLDDRSTATLEVSLQGATVDAHDVQVSWAGTVLGHVPWLGRGAAIGTFVVPASTLQAGGNDVVLTSVTGTGDATLVDHVRMTYPRLFRAAGETLAAVLPAGGSAILTGFSSMAMRVVDLSTPAAPREMPIEAKASPDGTFSAQVSVAADGVEHPIYAFTPIGVSSADSVTANKPSFLCATAGAEVAVVAPAAFSDALTPWVTARRAAGWSVELVDIEDVYDEMSYGAHSAAALNRFVRWRLRDASSRRLRDLLLVGDASLDPRNFLGKDVPDVVPTKLVDTATIETSSDDALADLDGDGVPDIAVGRWPAKTAEDVQGFVTRTLGFGDGPFSRGALVVAGPSSGFDFVQSAADVAAAVPVVAEQLNTNGLTADAARAALTSLWAKGPSFVTYLGHGSQGVWEGVLSMDDLSGTNPVGMPSVVASMTCLNGFFQDVYEDCLAERLMRADNGAAAVWASSSLEEGGAQGQLARAFEENLATKSLGDSARAAKASFASANASMVLFGDPTLFGRPMDNALLVAQGRPNTPSLTDVMSPSSVSDSSGCSLAGREKGVRGWAAGIILGLCMSVRRRRC